MALQQALQRGAEVSGIYHLAPQGETSWYGFADAIFTLARQQGLVLQLQAEKFEAITTSQYPTPATRPANSRLSLEKIEQTFGIQMPDWNSQLELTIEELLNSQSSC